MPASDMGSPARDSPKETTTEAKAKRLPLLKPKQLGPTFEIVPPQDIVRRFHELRVLRAEEETQESSKGLPWQQPISFHLLDGVGVDQHDFGDHRLASLFLEATHLIECADKVKEKREVFRLPTIIKMKDCLLALLVMAVCLDVLLRSHQHKQRRSSGINRETGTDILLTNVLEWVTLVSNQLVSAKKRIMNAIAFSRGDPAGRVE